MRLPVALSLTTLLLASACVPRVALVPGGPAGPVAGSGPLAVPLVRVGDPVGLRIAERAEALLTSDGRLLRKDCSGLVETVYRDLGLPLPELEVPGNSVAREFRGFQAQGALAHERPLPGDLAFFDDTYDRNRNGRVDDPLTHVAIVTALDLDGTATLVHYGSKGLAHFKMNLERTHAGLEHGTRFNDRLRWQKKRDPPGTRYLAAELFAGLGRPPEPPTSLAAR